MKKGIGEFGLQCFSSVVVDGLDGQYSAEHDEIPFPKSESSFISEDCSEAIAD